MVSGQFDHGILRIGSPRHILHSDCSEIKYAMRSDASVRILGLINYLGNPSLYGSEATCIDWSNVGL